MTHLYISSEEFKAQQELTGTTFADQEVDRAVKAASIGIEAVCRRRFWLDAEAVTRRYTPEGPLLEIDDLTELGAVTLKDTLLARGTDFELEPLNALADGRPYMYVRFLTRFPRGPLYASLSVTGRFGWPTVPDTISASVALLAFKTLMRLRQAPFGIVTAGADVGVAMRIARTDPDFAWLLRTFARERAQSLQLG